MFFDFFIISRIKIISFIDQTSKFTVTTRLRTFTFFPTRLRKSAQIFWLPVTKIPSVRTRLLIIVDYYTPHDYES
jgi:hypothetical protein